MRRRSILMCLIIAATVSGARAQASPSLPTAYDVTTIKPHNPADQSMMWRYREANYEGTNISLTNLIASAYNVKDWLVFGLPSWAQSARYDIQAKVSDADPELFKHLTSAQRGAMIAALLKDRFGLQVHTADKEQPVFELTALPEGIKFQPTPPLPSVDGQPPAKKSGSWSARNGELKATAVDINQLCENLSYQVERTVLNKTGLTGSYDLTLRWTPDNQQGKQQDNGTGADAPPDIFTALKEQLGLKLTATRAPVPTVVVDKITQPQDN